MSPDPYQPNFKPPSGHEQYSTGSDLESLRAGPDPGAASSPQAPPRRAEVDTAFATLEGKAPPREPNEFRRTTNDLLIDILTPCLIFAMVYSVIYFLLDVRFIYTEVHNGNFRFVAFFFVIGVVALNRLIARDGSGESMLYMCGLALAICLYSLSAPELNGYFGPIKQNVFSDPFISTCANMLIVIFLWWAVNRLTHECCVDENRVAGDVGILTGTLRGFQRSMRRGAKPKKIKKKREKPYPVLAPMYEFDAYDPVEGHQPKTTDMPPEAQGTLADRQARRHPGMSIFYFSIPVMFIFAWGLRVVQHAGESAIIKGQIYMIIYSVSALLLLMLTSLGGLRQYFRARRVAMPEGIGWFWVGLGVVMVAMVVLGAMQLPMPGLPPIAYVPEHKTDFWTQGSTFELKEFTGSPEDLLRQNKFMRGMGQGVLVLFALLFAYGALKGAAAAAFTIARDRDRYPRFIIRFFDALERWLSKLTRLPLLPKRTRRRRVQRNIATCAAFTNSMGDEELSERLGPSEHVQYAYDALCALAHDMGVPRETFQTPNEFLAAFPKELSGIQEEAQELTRLYMLAAYSQHKMDETVLDRVRKFWIVYERTRSRVLR